MATRPALTSSPTVIWQPADSGCSVLLRWLMVDSHVLKGQRLRQPRIADGHQRRAPQQPGRAGQVQPAHAQHQAITRATDTGLQRQPQLLDEPGVLRGQLVDGLVRRQQLLEHLGQRRPGGCADGLRAFRA